MNLRATLSGLTALATVVVGAAGCSSGESSAQADDGRLKVAVVLGGLANDGGFNQYAADAVSALEKDGLVDAQVRESVVNPADAEPIFRQFAAEDYDLVIGWGLGFSDSVFKVAEELPDTHFVATGSSDILERSTANVETWSYAFDEVGYLTGWVAGKSQLSPIAVVDGELAPFNELSYRYLSVGLKAANPEARELKPVFTGSWEDPKLAHQATKAQVAAGAKLVVTGAEGFTSGVIAAAKDAGIATFGASDGSSEAAAEVNIGLVKLDFTPTLRDIVDRLAEDGFGSTSHESTIANRGLILADFHPVKAAPQLPADIEAQIEELAAQLADGSVTIPEVE